MTMSSGITAQLATIPGREAMCLKTVESLLPQVRRVRVALNNYKEIPSWLNIKGVDAFLRNNERGDAEKFYDLPKGYIFTCDDDLIYPPDYVSSTMSAFDAYGAVILTYHGRDYPEKPILSYYGDRLRAYRCLGNVLIDSYVDVGGSGVMAWHTGVFTMDYSKIETSNMGDIWVAKMAFAQKVPIIVLGHKEGWILDQFPTETIWDKYCHDDQVQTDLYNSF